MRRRVFYKAGHSPEIHSRGQIPGYVKFMSIKLLI